jgi:hypothetical protein
VATGDGTEPRAAGAGADGAGADGVAAGAAAVVAAGGGAGAGVASRLPLGFFVSFSGFGLAFDPGAGIR